MAASVPNVWPEPVVGTLSGQVSDSVPTAPEACAVGDRPVHRLTLAVWAVLGSAPVTSTTNSSVLASTRAWRVMPPPDSVSTPS